MKLIFVCFFFALMLTGHRTQDYPLFFTGWLGLVLEMLLVRLELWFLARPRLSQWMGDSIFPANKPQNRRCP